VILFLFHVSLAALIQDGEYAGDVPLGLVQLRGVLQLLRHRLAAQVEQVTAEAIRGLFPFLPVPTLSLTLWLTATIGIVAFLTALAPFAYRGFALMRVATVGLAIVVLANVTGHIGGSLLAGAPMPGVYSTPLLAVAGVYGLVVAWRWEAEVTRAAAAAEQPPPERGST